MTRTAAMVGAVLLVALPMLALSGPSAAGYALLASTSLALLAAAACGFAAHRRAGRLRVGWLLLAAACLSWGLGNAYWSVNELIVHADVLFPSPADVGFALFPPAAGAGLWLITSTATRGARTTALLDGLIVVAALFIVSWGLTLRDVWEAGADSALGFLVTLAYPVGYVVVGTMAVLLAARTRPGARPVAVLLIAGLLGMITSDSLFALGEADGTYRSGTIADAGWIAAFAAFAMAGLRAARLAEPEIVVTVRHAAARRWQQLLPYAPFAVAAALCVLQVLRGHPIDGPQAVALLSGVGLVLGRQAVTLLRNSALTEQLRFQAFHDPLTGLANRALFATALDDAMARGTPVVLYLDLDDFKLVNDNLGHDAGDHLLRGVADRLRACFPEAPTVARLGGDEFAVLLHPTVVRRRGIRGADAAPADHSGLGQAAERLLEAMRAPFAVGPHTVAVTCSVGVAAGDTALGAEDLRKHVDLAMYAAKGRGTRTRTRCSSRPCGRRSRPR